MLIVLLEVEWNTYEVIRKIIKNSDRKNPNVIFEKDPKKIIEKLIEMLKKQSGNGEREMRL